MESRSTLTPAGAVARLGVSRVGWKACQRASCLRVEMRHRTSALFLIADRRPKGPERPRESRSNCLSRVGSERGAWKFRIVAGGETAGRHACNVHSRGAGDERCEGRRIFAPAVASLVRGMFNGTRHRGSAWQWPVFLLADGGTVPVRTGVIRQPRLSVAHALGRRGRQGRSAESWSSATSTAALPWWLRRLEGRIPRQWQPASRSFAVR